MRTIGPRALALIKHFEGLRLTAYRCPAGIPTIGYGSTGPHVRMGMTITEAEAERLLRQDLERFQVGVEKAAPLSTPAQFGAMVALAYNIGQGAFDRSTVRRRHVARDYAGAAEAFRMWVKVKVPRSRELRVSRGLVRRRAAERLLYLNDLPAFDAAIGYGR